MVLRRFGSRLLTLLVVVVWTCSGAALAQTAATPVTPSSPAPADTAAGTLPKGAPTEVVVTGMARDVSDRIDRRVYNIKGDPQAQTGTATDILGKLPSITVAPNGQVALRGDSGVQILIDGKPPISSNVLQSLPAADIDRIEVMTNPSAQYAPDGTSGVINIITRKKHPLGISGTLNGRLSTLGQTNDSVSTSFSKDRWTVTGRVSYNSNPDTQTNQIERTVPDTAAETTRRHSTLYNWIGGLDVARKMSDTQTLTLQGETFQGQSQAHSTGHFQSAALDYDESGHDLFRYRDSELAAIYDYNDTSKGRHFTLNADSKATHFDTDQNAVDTYAVPVSPPTVFDARLNWNVVNDDIKGDYERHYASGHELTAGFEWNRQKSLTVHTTTAGGAVNVHELDGEQTLSSAYLTYQFPVLGWTFMPGLRAEWEQHHVAASGVSAAAQNFSWHPSLHLTHNAGDKGRINLSYSHRIDRPDISSYDPAIIYYSVNQASQGNPNLKPSSTDSFEAGYAYADKDISYDTSLFYRATHGNFSSYDRLIASNVILSSQINSGNSSSGGVELTLKAPLTPRLKYSLNSNISYDEMPLVDGTSQTSRHGVGYGGNAMLEYDSAKGDELQLTLNFRGRSLMPQGYFSGFHSFDASWKHPLSKKLSLVVTAIDLSNSSVFSFVTDTPSLKLRNVSRPEDQTVKIALAYRFGGPALK